MSDMRHALAAAGGASHGSWQIGYMKRVVEELPGFDPGILSGTSVGGLFAAMCAQYVKFGEALDAYEDVWNRRVRRTRDIYRTWGPWWTGPFRYLPAAWKGSAFSTRPFRRIVQEEFHADQVRLSGNKLRITSVDLLSGRLVLHTEKDIVGWEPVYATAAYPIGFEPVEYDGGLHTDGGVRDIAPLRWAIEAGAERVDVLVTSPERMPTWRDDGLKILNRGLRTLDVALNEILENDLRVCRSINERVESGDDDDHRRIEVRVHRPSGPLYESSLNFDRDVWTTNYARGVADAEVWLRTLEED